MEAIYMKQLIFLAALTCSVLPARDSCARTWTEVPGAVTGTAAAIYGMKMLRLTDMWAVGSVSGNSKPLIEHWDGVNWAVVPNQGTSLGGYLSAVAGRSSDNLWAVGHTGQEQTLIEHWNGTNWVVVPSPNIGTYDELHGVEVVSRNDAWAVGYSISPAVQYILMHWDGASWSLVDGPPVTAGALSGLKAFASNDVWAVGTKNYFGTNSTTWTLHFDGTTWTEIPSPNADEGSYLNGIDGTAPNDVWAVGESTLGTNVQHTLAMHWDGTAWTVVPTPVISSDEGFYAVRAFPNTIVYAVGTSSFAPLSERWDGTQWRVIPTPPVDPGSILFAITGRDGAAWAAGYQNYFGQLDELFLAATPNFEVGQSSSLKN
jgi:hypothetical protein